MAETEPVEWSIHGTADISDARRRVADAASAAGLSPERSADVALVLSELATNALEHGSGSTAVVRCGVDDDQFELSVSSAASDDLPERRRDALEPAAGRRGLYIVARIADSMTVIGADGQVAVVCRFDLSAGR